MNTSPNPTSPAPRRGQQRQPQMPILDRLIDEAPEQETDVPLTTVAALERLRQSVRRDLEMLLNGKRRSRTYPSHLRELARSAISFGIPDCTAGQFHDKGQREVLRAEIEDTLRRFEPRLVSVRVNLLESTNPVEATLRLQIDALLHAEPAPEPVMFETVVDISTADVTVRAQDV